MPPAKSSASKRAARPAGLATPKTAPSEVPPAFTDPDTVQSYRTLYDALGQAYWKATSMEDKDTIQEARDTVYEILTDLNIEKLKANTELFLNLKSKIKANNNALAEIKKKIDGITKDLSTAASVIAAITKVLSLAPALA